MKREKQREVVTSLADGAVGEEDEEGVVEEAAEVVTEVNEEMATLRESAMMEMVQSHQHRMHHPKSVVPKSQRPRSRSSKALFQQ